MNTQSISIEQKSGTLAIVDDLFAAFHEAEVQYCFWKSDERLDSSMCGSSDLDVLVERTATSRLQQVLAEKGFLRYQAALGTAYPGVEDYLALDTATGQLVHLHLHYLFTVGEPNLKGYRLPWESAALAGRILDERFKVYTTSREMELLLFAVCDALKRRFRDRVKFWITGSTNGKFQRQFSKVADRADRAQVLQLAVKLIGPKIRDPLTTLIERKGSNDARRRFADALRPALKSHRSYSRPTAALLQVSRELIWALGGISKRKLHLGVPLRRISPRGGLVVALLGSDGAGKSTVLADTTKWLGQKLDVYPLYMGSGDGPASLVRLPLKLARIAVEGRSDAPSAENSRNPDDARKTSRLRSVGLLPWALTLAYEKAGKIRRMVRARNRGLVVVCDRFPQNQIDGFNDGPLLSRHRDSDSHLVRAVADWERRVYDKAAAMPPDLVIKLVASTETAMERRPELAREEIDRRIEAVRALSFPNETHVVEVNADQPLDVVLREVRSLIWSRL